jgi:hypothetical protein
MAHFVEEVVAFPVVVKVDRLGSVGLLVEEQIYLLILVVLLQVVKVDCLAQVVFKEGPNSPISGGGTGDNPGSGPVGPHGPYGPGPAGPREPRSIDDNSITKNNIYAPKTLEGPVIVNPQQAPTTTETTSQTDVTVAPTTTEEEQQQETNDDDSSQSTSTETQNQIPIANAGPSTTVQPTSNVVLDGTKSYDPNGGSLQFLWLQLAGGPTVALLNNATATPSFIAPSVPNTTTLTFQLIVNDGKSDSMPAYTYVTVQP